MPQRKTDKSLKRGTTVLTEEGVDNPNLKAAVQEAVRDFRRGRRNFRIDHTAMKPNPIPIYAYRINDKGEQTSEYRLLYGAGWSLSPEDALIAEKTLEDPKNKELNEEIWRQMRLQGVKVEKPQPKYKGTEVMPEEDEEDE